MRSRYYDRYPHYDERDPLPPYDHDFQRYGHYRRPRGAGRYGPSRRWIDAPPPERRYRRIAFDAGEPEPRRDRGWRRYVDEVGNTVREAGSSIRHQFERRRESHHRNRGGLEEDEVPGPMMERGRRFAQRYKEPLVGVALAGAAVPFAFGAAGGGQPGVEEARSQPIGEEVLAGRPTPRGTVEEDVGGRLASLRASRVREATIDGAMLAYGISRGLAEDIHDTAVDNGIEPELAFGLVKTESAFDHRAVSNVGARGLTQVMPRTARWLRPGTTVEDLYDRSINLNLGFGYLRDMIDKYDGDVRLALLAYNRGPGTVDRVLDAGQDPDNGYADLVLEGYTDLA
jgi:hypothetical protein